MPAEAQTIELHGSLYDLAAVRELAGQYGGVARLSLEEGDHAVTVRFDDIDTDVADVLVDHFCNHALVETVRRNSQAEARLRGELA
ncbi:MAG: hypothetical protein H6742_09675 [Alphaproteobacteria bacterium]|nr:hypothetical protein [Alphaproteobacteria bacterium]